MGNDLPCPKDPFVCPKKGINPTILLWGWDWDHQTYPREGYGSLGMMKKMEHLYDKVCARIRLEIGVFNYGFDGLHQENEAKRSGYPNQETTKFIEQVLRLFQHTVGTQP